ncbi:hypothetical protein cypCar_00004714 [Cyprinus carpio]|nr:hypothetical protein cypCar_00004714 [Cyprinus carpio]
MYPPEHDRAKSWSWGNNDRKCFLLQVGALISLSCVISTETFPAASQLSSCKRRDFMSKRPKDIPAETNLSRVSVLVYPGCPRGLTSLIVHSSNSFPS